MDPAFIISRKTAEHIVSQSGGTFWLPNEFGDDGDVILLVDGCILHGNKDTGIFLDCTGERAEWFEKEYAAGERDLVDDPMPVT